MPSHTRSGSSRQSRRACVWTVAAAGALSLAAPAPAAPGRERAVELIPELMGRILDQQEEIRRRESEMLPVIEQYDQQLAGAKRQIEGASSEEQAAEALVDYVEAYAARLEAQEEGLNDIAGPIVRMRADARDLLRAAEAVDEDPEPPEVRQSFYQDQFQGIATATSELAQRLGREAEAATAGAVLHASWSSHDALELPLPELGAEGAEAFARKVEGLYARYQARSNQLRAERQSVQRLLDVLIERQLARRLDSLFAGTGDLGLGALLSGEGRSEDYQELGGVVSRALGLPSNGDTGSVTRAPSMDRLDYFARGEHRGGR